MFLNTV